MPNGQTQRMTQSCAGKMRSGSTGQASFAVANPQVTPPGFLGAGDDLVAGVDQQVLDLERQPLVPISVVFHRYTFEGDPIRRSVVFTDRAKATAA